MIQLSAEGASESSETRDVLLGKHGFGCDLEQHGGCDVTVPQAGGARLMSKGIVGLAFLGLMGCSTGRYPVVIGPREPDVVVVGDDGRDYPDGDYPDRRGRGRGNRDDDSYRGYRTLRVPRGHYPPPGACRVWYVGRPPGHQPPPVRCDRLYGRAPYGAFVLYNGNAWDADYDWVRHERRYRDSVPRVILRITGSRRDVRR